MMKIHVKLIQRNKRNRKGENYIFTMRNLNFLMKIAQMNLYMNPRLTENRKNK